MNPKKYFLLSFLIFLISFSLINPLSAVDVDIPNYKIMSLTSDRTDQVQGGYIVFTTVVKNVGEGATLRTSSLVWQYCTTLCAKEENWSTGETDTISGLRVGQEEIETYSHEVTSGGPLQIRVKCDYVEGSDTGVITESDELDNEFVLPELTISYPDLQIASYDENGTQPMIWWTPKNPIEGQEVTFYAGVTNRGAGGTTDDFEVEFIIYIDQKEHESVSLGNEKYQEGIPLGPNPQNYTFCYISSKDTWPAVSGTHSVRAHVNPGGDIVEKNNVYDNLSDPLDISIQKPELKISNVWWVPEVPTDGEEVTFYASIINQQLGGSILEFDVDFTLTELDFEYDPVKDTSLGTTTVVDQILPAQKEIIDSFNYDVDYINREDWNVISGTVSIESYCADNDSMCLNKLKNQKYVKLSGKNTIIRSKNTYDVYDNEILVFRANASGTGKRWFSLCKPGTDCTGTNQLRTQEVSTSKDSWKVYVMDISDLVGEKFSCEIKTGTSTNIVLKVDDIGKSPIVPDGSTLQPVMFSIPISEVWEAFPFSDKINFTPGRFNITAKLSDDNLLTESLHDESAPGESWIDPADYDFVSINVSPPTQFIGKNFLYEVVIKNYGGPTLIESNMNWYLSVKENQYGKSLETDSIPGLARNETYAHTFELPVISGNINVHAFINDDFLLKEKNNWSEDNTQYNRAFDMRFVDDVDLEVKKIWWRVEDPLDNQDPSKPLEGQEVRFYARIDNVGLGGAITDFDVQFIVDEGQYEEIDLKTTTVKDDILFGKLGWESQPGFTNAGFEGNCSSTLDNKNKLCDWTIVSGGVSQESYCGIDDTQCICSRSNDTSVEVNASCNPDDLDGNLYYARLYGGGTKFRSSTFFVNSDIIEFKAQVTGSGTKKLRLCENADSCMEQTYTGKSYWNAYVLDVSSYIGKQVYIELVLEGTGSMEFWVDDFRMNNSSNNNVYVTTVASKDTWEATTGSHEISVKADVKNVLAEPDDYDPNNETSSTNNVDHTTITKVNQTDYWIKQPADFPVLQYQIKGRDVQVMAEIINIGSGTSLETDLYWYTCLDTENPSCRDQDNWKDNWGNPAQKIKVPALSENQSYTSLFTYTAEYGNTYIIAEVNPELNVSELYVNNNTVYYDAETKVNKPSLNVQSIWWLPENPNDGEEVTFYAAIENKSNYDTGATLDDFEVSFIVMDEVNPEQNEDLGTTKIKDDIPMADRRIIDAFDEQDCVFATREKESNKWYPWQHVSGSASVVDRCNQQGSTCETNISNRYYARLYGSEALIRSNSFNLINDIITFSGYTDGSGTKTIRIRQELVDGIQNTSDPILYEEVYTEKQTWRANLIKMPSGHTYDKVYIEVLTQDAANAEFVIDDFRMSPPSTDNVFVTIAESNKVWTASPGSFNISVAVTIDGASGAGKEKKLASDDPLDTTLIKKADYQVSALEFTPEKQVQGEDIQATAKITNIGGTTLVESEIQWALGDKTTKETLSGLAANEVYTTTFTFTPEYGVNEIKITADAGEKIIEENENNELSDQIEIFKPDLKIGPIWWSPENPKDGQEVTFFARVDNEGKGGTSDDLEVRFLVSKGLNGSQVEVSKEKITADIPFALGTAAFKNADFSGEDSFLCSGLPSCDSNYILKYWDYSGNVFSESRCTIDDLQCPEKIIEDVDTTNYKHCGYKSYVRLSGNSTLTSSEPFNKVGVKYILFKAYVSGSGDAKVQILDSTKKIAVIEVPITNKSWAAQIIDVAPYNLDFNNKDYYFRAVTEGADNAAMMIDDIRIVSTTENTCSVMVAKVQASKNWIAQPDPTSDYYIHVEATDNTQTITRYEPINTVSKADYQIIQVTNTPKEQTKGKTVSFVALLENKGSDTLVESELSWFTCYANCGDEANWKKIWKEQQTETIPALAENEQYTSTYVLTTEFGDNFVRVFCDSGNVIVEPVEEENAENLENFDNVKTQIIAIEKPDLRISRIGYLPEKPLDGESVTFYAQIENIEKGGTIDEIETTFLITDANGVETTIEAEKSDNEVLFAYRQPIFSNADFEQGSLEQWTKKGPVFLIKDSLTHEDYNVIKKESDARVDKFYARIYGDGSTLLSSGFTISNAQSIIFKGQTSGSGTKQVSIRKCTSSTSTECTYSSSDHTFLTQEFTESSPWRTCILDVSDINNEYVYLEIKTSGSDNSEFWVDDFRMKSGTDITYVSTVPSKNEWTAFPGNHTLRATVDSKDAISEYNENNNYLEESFNLINAVDYSIASLTFTPQEQVQGKEIVFTAVIKNDSSNSTLIESELEWFVCQGAKKTCDYENKWVSESKEKISGLDAGKEYTSTFNMEVTYEDDTKSIENYLLQVKVVCDTGNVLIEDNGPNAEDNNEAIQHIEVYHPDLVVGDIWWIPENPVYGEAVTFYARIDNIEKGGSIQDFDVNFTVDYWNEALKKELGSTKVSTEIPFAKRKLLGSNPSFENGLTSWTKIAGNTFWESKCPENDSDCPGSDAFNRYGDLYYASVYGANSILQSEKITERTGNSLLFRGMTEGSGTKKLVIVDESGKQIIEQSYTDKAPWRAYVLDIQKIPENTVFYIQVHTSGSDNAKFMVDNFRMSEDASKSIVGYVQSKSTWSATPDESGDIHSISVIIDEKNDVKEVDDTLDEGFNISTEQLTSIGRPDYRVSITDYSPRKQIQGRNITLTAVVENPLSTTLLDSELQWSTCQDSRVACLSGSEEGEKYWKKQQTDKIVGGIAEGQKYTAIYIMEVPTYQGTEPQDNPDGYTIYVRAIADANNIIDEIDDEAEVNIAIQQIEVGHPDLIVNDVWWKPFEPIDGMEVTFYAQIQNQGHGGTLEDYEVSFIVDDGLSTKEDLGSAKMQDDILFGNRLPLLSDSGINMGDFENNTILSKSDTWPLTDWTRISGEVYITNHFEETVLPVLPDNTDVANKKYLYVSGSGSVAQSSPFKLSGDALMFRAQTNGSGIKTLRIRPLTPDPDHNKPDPLIEKTYDEKSPWRAYLLDVEKWEKVIAYLEIETSGGSIQLDDFRMIETATKSGSINVGTAVNSKTWLARPGAKITVIVDSKTNIYEDARSFDNFKRSISNIERDGETNNSRTEIILLATYTEGLGDIDNNGRRELKDLIIAAQIVADFSNSLDHSIVFDNVDVDADNQIGLAEMIYLMIHLSEKQEQQQYK